ncbi:MAG: 6,7-dimethyl-8-ribityllumazine synthase [Alphaproteobacteria bacterium]|nr:6,7-dimethyl-8-ribityllumazine synthase [Alphaproteobacteria bacterium]
MSRILIVEARFYNEISDLLLEGAVAALKQKGIEFDSITVPGALEIPAIIKQKSKSGRYDGYIALGCVIRGQTSHYDIVAGESARGLMDLTIHYDLAIGNGILTCETQAQAIERAHPERKNKGAFAVDAVLCLMETQK